MNWIDILGWSFTVGSLASYAFEHKHWAFRAAFAGFCAVGGVYAALIQSWPLLASEAVWIVTAKGAKTSGE